MLDPNFQRSLAAAKNFYEALTATIEEFWTVSDSAAQLAAQEKYKTIQNDRFQEVDMDDLNYGFLLPNAATFLGFALRQIEKDPTQNFDEVLFSMTGSYTWHFCGQRVDYLAAIMGMQENILQKKLEKVGYKIENHTLRYHPGQDANSSYDESYFSRLHKAQNTQVFRPKI